MADADRCVRPAGLTGVPKCGMRLVASLLVMTLMAAGCAAEDRTVSPPPSAAVTPTAEPSVAATPDAEAELRRIERLRSGWGLRSDRAWITAVQSNPAAVMSELGILVTPDEARELAEIAAQEPRTRLIWYGTRERQQFAGLWVNDVGFDVVMLFTGDLDRHRAAVAGLAPGLRVDVRPARFAEHELRSLQEELARELVNLPGVEFMSLSLDTRNNVLLLEAKSNDPTLKGRLEERYGGRLVADIYALPGPWANVEGGPGWRLLAAGESRGGWFDPPHVQVAKDAAAWEQLWAIVDPVNPRPEIDPASEVVALFAEGIGGSCPERRLDGVVIDHADRRVYARTSDPLAPRTCDAMLAGAALFVVALERDALPAGPFSVAFENGPGIEVDLQP